MHIAAQPRQLCADHNCSPVNHRINDSVTVQFFNKTPGRNIIAMEIDKGWEP